MQIRFGFDIALEFPAPTSVVLMLHLRPELASRLFTSENVLVAPELTAGDFRDGFGNRCTRLVAPAGLLQLRCDASIRDSGLPAAIPPEPGELPVSMLPAAVLPFLLPSRYCEVDLLGELAWSHFSATPPG